MNGYTEREIAKRDKIRELIESRKYEEARDESASFLLWNSERRVKRNALLRTIKNWMAVMNRDPNIMKGGVDENR